MLPLPFYELASAPLLPPAYGSSDHKHANSFRVLEPSSHQPARTLATGDRHIIEFLSGWEAVTTCARDPFAVLEAAGSWPPSPDWGLLSDTCLGWRSMRRSLRGGELRLTVMLILLGPDSATVFQVQYMQPPHADHDRARP